MRRYDPNSVFDSFKRLGYDPSYENRKTVYYGNYGLNEYYRFSWIKWTYE